MPELPEVETVRRGLADLLPGQAIVRATVFDSPKSFPNSPTDVQQFFIRCTRNGGATSCKSVDD